MRHTLKILSIGLFVTYISINQTFASVFLKDAFEKQGWEEKDSELYPARMSLHYTLETIHLRATREGTDQRKKAEEDVQNFEQKSGFQVVSEGIKQVPESAFGTMEELFVKQNACIQEYYASKPLPHELWQMIFSEVYYDLKTYFQALPLVCKRWKELIEGEEGSLARDKKEVARGYVKYIKNRGDGLSFLKGLTLSDDITWRRLEVLEGLIQKTMDLSSLGKGNAFLKTDLFADLKKRISENKRKCIGEGRMKTHLWETQWSFHQLLLSLPLKRNQQLFSLVNSLSPENFHDKKDINSYQIKKARSFILKVILDQTSDAQSRKNLYSRVGPLNFFQREDFIYSVQGRPEIKMWMEDFYGLTHQLFLYNKWGVVIEEINWSSPRECFGDFMECVNKFFSSASFNTFREFHKKAEVEMKGLKLQHGEFYIEIQYDIVYTLFLLGHQHGDNPELQKKFEEWGLNIPPPTSTEKTKKIVDLQQQYWDGNLTQKDYNALPEDIRKELFVYPDWEKALKKGVSGKKDT